MKITRSSKYSLKFQTEYKRTLIESIFDEYTDCVNFYVSYFWIHPKLNKSDIKKEVLDMYDGWFSQRIKQCASRQALAIVQSARSRRKKKPFFKGNTMALSSNCVKWEDSKDSTFDSWIHISSVGNKLNFRLPIRSHKHANQFNDWKRSSTFTFHRSGLVSVSYETETGEKKPDGLNIGVDLGLNKLFACSDNTFKADKSLELVKKVSRKKKNSKAHHRAKEELKSYINHSIKTEFDWKSTRLVVVEKIKDLKRNMKVKGRLTKTIRSVISNLPTGYIIDRIQSECERNRVSFRSVPAYYTSITCRKCGHRDKMNRSSQEQFCCSECGHSEHADIHASKNILERFILGPYGAEFKH